MEFCYMAFKLHLTRLVPIMAPKYRFSKVTERIGMKLEIQVVSPVIIFRRCSMPSRNEGILFDREA